MTTINLGPEPGLPRFCLDWAASISCMVATGLAETTHAEPGYAGLAEGDARSRGERNGVAPCSYVAVTGFVVSCVTAT